MMHNLSLLVHIISMVGTLGGLMFIQFGLSSATRNTPEVAGKAGRFFSVLIAVGFVAGLALYMTMIKAAKLAGYPLSGHIHGIIGTKMLLLVVAGGLLGMSGKSAKGDLFRRLAIGALGVASILGVNL